MNPEAMSDLGGFHQFLGEKLYGGEISQTPEDVLDEWRTIHPELALNNEDFAAIQEAVDDMASGDMGLPWDSFDRDFRTRHGLPAKS